MFPYHEEIPYPTPQCIVNAIADETVIGWIDDSNAFVRLFLESSLQDDGSICLGFLIVVVAIRQITRYFMSIWSRSLESSPGYSCSDTATTYTNSSSSNTSRSSALSSLEGDSNRSVGITVVRPW